MMNVRLAVALVAVVPAGALGAAYWLAPGLYEDDLATPVAHREAEWTGSDTCESCHPDQYASWYRTFHRTMTQEATPKTVLGDFNGERLTFGFRDATGNLVTARPLREGDRFFMELSYASGKTLKLEIHRTVGSRRYQQYLVKEPAAEAGENYHRIPILWHIGDQRWIHLNGAFLGHDEELYDQHWATWNQNCIFCHNTGPEPGWVNREELIARAQRGEPVDSAAQSKYRSTVAELGISCESCHAPAGEHARRNRNPLRRYFLHRTGSDDPTIVNPSKLAKERSVEVCGQCHGQRLPDPPETITDWMTTGPLYRSGEVLVDSVAPVRRETFGPPNKPDMFSRRFWDDGTPRLTAYEYQGLLMSPCYQKGELTCISCHTMHDGDVFGQLPHRMRTKAACASCHQEIARNVKAHTHHEPESSGSDCYECHMPKMMYGILDIHRSHRIHNPDPAADAAAARPNACTNCHLDKSLVWAAEKTRQLWGESYAVPVERADGAPVELAEVTASLMAGDPVQRAVASRLAGRSDMPLEIEQRAFLWPVLLQGLDDRYPTIRYFSKNSLLELQQEMRVPGITEALERFDYIAPKAQRDVVLAELLKLWETYSKQDLPAPPPGTLVTADYQLSRGEVESLLALQGDKLIHIGE